MVCLALAYRLFTAQYLFRQSCVSQQLSLTVEIESSVNIDAGEKDSIL